MKQEHIGEFVCQLCGREHKCKTTFLEEFEGGGIGYFRSPFLDQLHPCPGVADMKEAVAEILDSGIFLVHLYPDKPETIRCWQDRIVGNPNSQYYPGVEQQQIAIDEIVGLWMQQDGNFIAQTAHEFVSIGVEVHGPNYRAERLIRFY